MWCDTYLVRANVGQSLMRGATGLKMESFLVWAADQVDNAATACPPAAAVASTNSAALFLGRLRNAAAAEGISCLASAWDNWQASYPFECRHSHRFSCSASFVVQHRIACPDCRDAERLAKPKHVAYAKGGQCLETAWQGGGVRHRFQCARGHVWQAMPSKVMSEGSWCRRCAQQDHGVKRMRKDGLASLQEVAQLRGGKLFDTVYGGMYLRYRFSCSNGHSWQAAGPTSYEVHGAGSVQTRSNASSIGYQMDSRVCKPRRRPNRVPAWPRNTSWPRLATGFAAVKATNGKPRDIGSFVAHGVWPVRMTLSG